MIEWLEHIDQKLLVLINGWHNPMFDYFFWYVSKAWISFPVYAITMVILFRHYTWKKSLFIVGFIILTAGLTDLISSRVFKEGVKRYRPSHHLVIGPKLHYYEESPGVYYRGGQYGFISSHAANYAGFYFFIVPLIQRKNNLWLWVLGCWGILVCYSRMYLGVHYPSDIVGGILVGGFLGFTTQVFAKKTLDL